MSLLEAKRKMSERCLCIQKIDELQGIADTGNSQRLKGRVNNFIEEKSTEVATSLCLP